MFRPRLLEVVKCGNRLCGHLYARAAAPNHGIQSGRDLAAEVEAFRTRNARLVDAWFAHGFLRRESAVLDFGSGAGHIAHALRNRVRSVTCVEADGEAQAWLRQNGLDLRESLAACDGDYDAALLVEVVEHLEDPIAVLRELRCHLAPSGNVFLTTPCGETRVGDHRTNAYDTPEHVQFFTERSLSLAARAAGFHSIRFVWLPQLYPEPARPGLRRAISAVRRQLMPLLSRIRGHSHLVAYLQ
jgi:SAM-dependent methyltransferase